MTWNQLQNGLDRRATVPAEEVIDETYSADVLLQIILPMVLVLAFLVINALRHFEEQTRPASQEDYITELNKSLIKLQRQKLLLALDRIEQGRRSAFGIDYFVQRIADLTNSGQLLTNDPLLVAKCQEINAIYQTPTAIEQEKRRLYALVLKDADVQDSPSAAPQVQAPPSTKPNIDDHLWITAENRQFVTERIAGLMDALRTEITDRQRDLVRHAFLYYARLSVDELYRWHPQLQSLREEIARLEALQQDASSLRTAQTEEVRQKMKQDFRAQGYLFLEDAWNPTTSQ